MRFAAHKLKHQQTRLEYCNSHNEGRELPRAPMRDVLGRRNVLGALYPLRCHFKSPGNDESDRKTEDDYENDKPDRPIRNLEERKNLRGDLDQEPGDNRVSNCNPVDVAPLQLGEKVARVHSFQSQVTFGPVHRGVSEPTYIFFVSCRHSDLLAPETVGPSQPNCAAEGENQNATWAGRTRSIPSTNSGMLIGLARKGCPWMRRPVFASAFVTSAVRKIIGVLCKSRSAWICAATSPPSVSGITMSSKITSGLKFRAL